MNKAAGFGGSDTSGYIVSTRRRLGCEEENRLCKLAQQQGVKKLMMRFEKRLDCLVPECFGLDHPEILISINNVEEKLKLGEKYSPRLKNIMFDLGLS